MFNKSTWFLLPMVGLHFYFFLKEGYKKTVNLDHYYLYNTYLDEQNRKLYIICKDSNEKKYRELISIIENNPNIERLSTKDGITTVCFNIPEKWNDNFNIFLSGKYTKLSDEYKQLLIRIYDIEVNIHKILYPKPLDIQKIRNNYNIEFDVEEIYSVVDKELERFKDMFVVLKSEEDKYKDVAVALYDSTTGTTKIMFTINPNLSEDPHKTAQNLVDIINKNINDFDKSNIKDGVKA